MKKKRKEERGYEKLRLGIVAAPYEATCDIRENERDYRFVMVTVKEDENRKRGENDGTGDLLGGEEEHHERRGHRYCGSKTSHAVKGRRVQRERAMSSQVLRLQALSRNKGEKGGKRETGLVLWQNRERCRERDGVVGATAPRPSTRQNRERRKERDKVAGLLWLRGTARGKTM
ncbi:hypothetical protein AMTR_s00083p00129490 [Amborella trichopoda]|uniref:Uncharacterized protein n=1 Tax=Amborella trichopoda TaxID=13333 RepID=W1P6C3_AMBTC|nr:hypothetical protein AMTR_s00083p00129490 [Amborella trichopoda]